MRIGSVINEMEFRVRQEIKPDAEILGLTSVLHETFDSLTHEERRQIFKNGVIHVVQDLRSEPTEVYSHEIGSYMRPMDVLARNFDLDLLREVHGV